MHGPVSHPTGSSNRDQLPVHGSQLLAPDMPSVVLQGRMEVSRKVLYTWWNLRGRYSSTAVEGPSDNETVCPGWACDVK